MRNALSLSLLLVIGCAELLAQRAAPLIPPDARARMEAQLSEARAAWARDTSSADALIWVGRRTAYLGRFQEAIDIFSDGIKQHPLDARFYRHRGHRYLTIRKIDLAIADFEKAVGLTRGQPDQIEPDGQPNARNIPTSSLQSNIWYHLALGRYLKGDFNGAAAAWTNARDVLENDDNLVATSAWLYVSLRRAGRTADAAKALAPIRPDLNVIENGSYLSLLLLHKGERTEADVIGGAGAGSAGSAVRYGVSVWHLLNGRAARAREMWTEIAAAPDWPSFGVLAAEIELTRIK
ncbi:MAG: hypothetical protein EPO35_10075 [Acidobacteria bacterium]|nr:MAG: hypothetical protein EPO35_10075 [Acidobacteriota bacterium]